MAAPVAIAPVGARNGVVFAGKLPGSARPIERAGIAPTQFPPPSGRLLPSAPPVLTLAASPLPTMPAVSPLPSVNGIPALPPGAKLYCSPWSVLYNTGSICFNPDIETVNPDFYPWGLFSPPPFVNAPGFLAPIPPGQLVQYCPRCVEAATGLLPSQTPLDHWRQATSGSIAGLATNPPSAIFARPAAPMPPPRPSAVAPTGPAVILVLKDGTSELVSRYWLGQDWLLHFITVNGSRQAIPLNSLNLKATGAANYERGVTFVIPAWPEPRRTS